MADEDIAEAIEAGEVLDAYYTRFGREADFDRWTMTGKGAIRLMREALKRGTPVTQEDMHRVFKDMFGTAFPTYPPGAIL